MKYYNYKSYKTIETSSGAQQGVEVVQMNQVNLEWVGRYLVLVVKHLVIRVTSDLTHQI